MKKLVLLFALILTCGYPDLAVASDSVDGKDIEVGGISISDDKDRVKNLLGDPRESGPTCDGCFDIMDSWFIYDGIRVHFLQREVLQFEVSSERYRLSSGVGVGTSKDDVVKHYGQPETTQHEDGVILAYPITWNGRGHPDVKLEFLIRDDIVVGFQAGPTRTGSPF